MVHYNWPLSSCRWHTVSALNIISAFAYLRSFFFFLSFLLVPSSQGSFRDSIFQKVIIIHEAAYQYVEIALIGNEGACLIVVFSFALSSANVEQSPREWGRISVFVWLYLTLLCSGVHCISLVVKECSLLSSSSSSPSPPRLHISASPWVE